MDEVRFSRKEFRVRLRELRMQKHPDVDLKILSQRMGLHSDALRRYENGETIPRINSASKIAVFYEVTLDYLIHGIK